MDGAIIGGALVIKFERKGILICLSSVSPVTRRWGEFHPGTKFHPGAEIFHVTRHD